MEGTNQASKIEVCIKLLCSHMVVRLLLPLFFTVYIYTDVFFHWTVGLVNAMYIVSWFQESVYSNVAPRLLGEDCRFERFFSSVTFHFFGVS